MTQHDAAVHLDPSQANGAALLGYGASALAYAAQVREYFLARDTPDWEIAFTHAIYAHAARDSAAHREAYTAAIDALAGIADDEDREIVARTFSQVPVPLPAKP